MNTVQRCSAVQFTAASHTRENRENWTVILQYQDEGAGPWLVDLSHKSRFDLQDSTINEYSPGGVAVPPTPGMSVYTNTLLINRLNAGQASLYCLGSAKPQLEMDTAYTDVTDATVFLALFGPKIFHVTEKLTALDFLAPHKEPPFLYQGPFCHVPCQIVTLQRRTNGSGGILLSCSRGYAKSMVEAILDAGEEFGLRPAGEDRFTGWLESPAE
ncbi:MAG: sarcosine oxidase subunit gamma SoxG [Desulfopila sp.]